MNAEQIRREAVAPEPVATACNRKRCRERPVARPRGRSGREVDSHMELHRCFLARSSRIWPPERARHHRIQNCGNPGSSGTWCSWGRAPWGGVPGFRDTAYGRGPHHPQHLLLQTDCGNPDSKALAGCSAGSRGSSTRSPFGNQAPPPLAPGVHQRAAASERGGKTRAWPVIPWALLFRKRHK